MADAITVDDAESLREYAEKLTSHAWLVCELTKGLHSGKNVGLGEAICQLHDRLRLVTAVLDRIDENRH